MTYVLACTRFRIKNLHVSSKLSPFALIVTFSLFLYFIAIWLVLMILGILLFPGHSTIQILMPLEHKLDLFKNIYQEG